MAETQLIRTKARAWTTGPPIAQVRAPNRVIMHDVASIKAELDTPPDEIMAYPAALLEQGKWFPALRFEVHGEPFGDDFVLRTDACATAEEAVAIAAAFLDFADDLGSRAPCS